MELDRFLPRFDVQSEYATDVQAPPSAVYRAARDLDLRDSRLVRLLYRLRGLPDQSLTFDGMMEFGFTLLADIPDQEIVFGLVGRFWFRSPDIRNVSVKDFPSFEEPGLAKVAANISIVPRANGQVRVATETRVQCFGQDSRRRFGLYWGIIRPFSGLVRKEWLRLIREKAEKSGI